MATEPKLPPPLTTMRRGAQAEAGGALTRQRHTKWGQYGVDAGPAVSMKPCHFLQSPTIDKHRGKFDHLTIHPVHSTIASNPYARVARRWPESRCTHLVRVQGPAFFFACGFEIDYTNQIWVTLQLVLPLLRCDRR